MEYREYLPAPTLTPYVKCYWVLRALQAASSVDRIFPDGCTELIFHRGGRFAQLGTDGGVSEQPRSLYYGQLDRFIILRRARRVETIGVRFHPAGAVPLLHVAANEISGHSVGFADLGGRPARELEERVHDAASARSAIRRIESYLLARLDAASSIDPAITASLARIRATSGGTSVNKLARLAGVGVRQLERKFAVGVGLSPKRLATVTRLQGAFALIEAGGCTPLTDVAQACGYFDQSHFIRDFRRLAGLSPSRFLREERGIGHLFVGH